MTAIDPSTPAEASPDRRRRFDRLARLAATAHDHPGRVLAALALLALGARLVWLWLPQGSLIFDEAYYVNAARVLLGWHVPAGAAYAGSPIGLDPNTEHPPLGKLLLAGSMAAFGDNGIGWRIPSVVAGMIALAALHGIVRISGETKWFAVVVVGFFAFDNLAFVHGRIGTLDSMLVAAILIGALFALRERWLMAGAIFGVGSLVKISGIFGLGAILLMQLAVVIGAWRRHGQLRFADLRPTVLMASVYGAVFLVGLWLLDYRFSSYANPLDHLGHMLSFGSSLQAPGGPTGIASYPWQWIVNDGQINYLRVAVDSTVNGQVVASHPTIDFRGALNPILIGAAPLAFLFAIWSWLRGASPLATWCVAWAAANYLPYYALAIVSHRIMYLYYFLPVVPALAVAVALLLRRSGLPNLVTLGFVAAFGLGFLAYFPFRVLP